jgi:hypothetical protein
MDNGWLGLPRSLRDVIREESQIVETSTKKPDYTFRIAGIRKFFTEAKKPSLDIRTSREAAFQVRRYGWSAGLPVSVLTNFRSLRVYDTRTAPSETDDPDVGLLFEFDYRDYLAKFDELSLLLSRESVASGEFDRKVGVDFTATVPVNKIFLERINDWRLRLAIDLLSRYGTINLVDLNDISQKIINRIICIRMCEDRGIESHERLKKVAGKKNFVELRRLFQDMDNRYDTSLFAVTHDPLQSKYAIDASVFLGVVEELYLPKAPYSFSVLDSDFLGQVYEIFLTQRLTLEGGSLVLKDKPAYEDREIITTPQPIVDEIVRRTLNGLLGSRRKDSEPIPYTELVSLRILDIAVGSSRFLLRVFDILADEAIQWFRSQETSGEVYEAYPGDWRLSFEKKRELLTSCLYGIDIDYNAVEVARFSLLVKLLEDENVATLPPGRKILPNLDGNIICGNSVIDESFTHPDTDVMEHVNPITWSERFPSPTFSAIVGNPPYVKTEEMKVKTPYELAYYKKRYSTPYRQFDKYFVFVERAIEKIDDAGWIGMVVPNKWITIEAGKKLRGLLAGKGLIAELVDFGSELVFEGKSTYVCLLVLAKRASDAFAYKHITKYDEWIRNPSDKGFILPKAMLKKIGEESWVLPGDPIEAKVLTTLFANNYKLEEVVEIFNGIQTSAERIYSIDSWKVVPDGFIEFSKTGKTWKIESSITKPYLVDSETIVWSYSKIRNDCLVIFPYEIGASGESILISPSEMARRFPFAWRYLSAYRTDLARRDVQPAPTNPEEFYRYGRHQALAKAFIEPKIVVSVNQTGDKYGIDVSGVGIASGGTAGEIGLANPSMGYSLYFILALLNQRVIEYFCRKRGSPFRGRYYSRGTAVLKDVPVPKIDFRNKKQKGLHDLVAEETRRIIDITERMNAPSSTLRDVEKMKNQIVSAKARTEKCFEELFGLKGAARRLNLP